jgi:hypothetical protein
MEVVVVGGIVVVDGAVATVEEVCPLSVVPAGTAGEQAPTRPARASMRIESPIRGLLFAK